MTDANPNGIDIIRLPMDRIEEFVHAASIPFSFDPDEDILESSRNWDMERVIAALDGESVVGTAATFRYPVTLPGGNHLFTSGVTFVSVLPTHRRRGVLTAIMRRTLGDAHERGEPLASLWASETMIYGRYGFGESVEAVSYRIKRARSAFSAPVEPSGRVRLVDVEEALSLLPDFHASIDWVGKFGRDAGHWRSWTMWDPEFDREGYTKRRIAVYEESGSVLGYTFYRTKWSRVRVDELVAQAPGARVALYRFLFGIDLMDEIELRAHRADEPLRWMLDDTRALRRHKSEYMWFRLLDLPACLEGRTYGVPGRIVFDVTDSFAPWNQGRWVLETDGGRATCSPTDGEPDLELDTSVLAALYMGGRSAPTMAAAGLIKGSEEAVVHLDAMFRTAEAPWSPESY
jgi:predicted acetyltransferase